MTPTNYTGYSHSSVSLINRLSDHNAQLLILNTGQKKECHTYTKRKINKYTIADFQLKLSHETWELVFDGNDVNKIFNSLLNIFLRIYYSSFPLIQAKCKMNQNSWIIPGAITSCKHKRELYKELQINNNATLASYYRNYTTVVSVVIRKAKIIEHDKLILNSHNKVKTTWSIIIQSYLHRLKIIGSPECPCKHSIQPVDHLIFQCKRLKKESEILKNSVLRVGNWPVSKSELMNKNLKQLISYINSMDLEKLNHSNEEM